MVTIFKDIFSKEPIHVSIDTALERIRTGVKSKEKVIDIRNAIDKTNANNLKLQLPSVCFSGIFNERKDEKIIEHSGFLVLDFDAVSEIDVKAAYLANNPFIYALWVSPSGTGLKALIRLSDGKKHREHFQALKEIFPDVDKSGINESRVCYESYDPNIYINKNAKVFTKIVSFKKIEEKSIITEDAEKFKRLLKWLANKGSAFVTGERNIFIYKLASACCRFGIDETSVAYLILSEYPSSNDFSNRECVATIKSAYKSNKNNFGDASFENDILINKISRKEVDIPIENFDLSIHPKDVIYASSVKSDAMDIYFKGYETINGIGVKEFDDLYKSRKGEITCLTGIGNYGKTTLFKWITLMKALLYGEKMATFSPEDSPAADYYLDYVEILLGCDCSINNSYRPNADVFRAAYDFVGKHIFYVYPESNTPSPQYIKERFLEVIIKEKVSQLCIDPFNQLVHDYKNHGGKIDTYLEYTFGDFSRFSQANNVNMMIIAHPVKLIKQANGNYPCPDVYDLAGGGMWSNKMDNILVYHRPFMQTDPASPVCEFHTRKVRRQKTVGRRGSLELQYNRRSRRYEIGSYDYMADALKKYDLFFNKLENDNKEQIISDSIKNFFNTEYTEPPF